MSRFSFSFEICMLVGVMALSSACSLPELSGDDNGLDDAEGDGGGDGDGDGDEGGDEGGDEDGVDEGGGDGDGDSCFLDCGSGECVESDAGYFCQCEDGETFNGETCVPCQAVNGDTFDIDVDVVTVSGSISINGESPPASPLDSGELWLRNVYLDDEVYLGSTADGTYSARVVPGTYEILYRSDGKPKPTAPMNTNAVVRPLFEINESDSIGPIDLEVISVVPTVTLNDQPVPKVEVDDGIISLENSESGDVIVLGRTSSEATASRVLTGSYDVVYSVDTVGESMPANEHAVVANRYLGSATGTVSVPANLETVPFTLEATLDNGSFPNTEVDDGIMSLESTDGDRVVLGRTSSPPNAVNVLDRVYNVVYSADSVGPLVPANSRAVIGQVDPAAPQSVAVETEVVEPQVMVDEFPPPDVEVDDGELWLVDDDGEVALGVTSSVLGARVIKGEYRLEYRSQTPGEFMPANTGALVQIIDTEVDPAPVVELETVFIDGGFTINDELPPDSAFASGRVMLENVETGDVVLLGRTHEGAFAQRVLAGLYDIYYAVDLPGPGVPINEHAKVDAMLLDADQSFTLDIPTKTISGNITFSSQAAPDTPADSGRLYVRAGTVGDGASIGATTAQSYEVEVVPGSYAVYFRSDGSEQYAPRNSNARVSCMEVVQ